MKKMGKAGLGHLKKMERKNRQMSAGRIALATESTAAKVRHGARRRCG
jgi:hypothetical protein